MAVDFSAVEAVDPTRVAEATRRLEATTMAAGGGRASLGELAAWGGWLAACQGRELPAALERVTLAVAAGEPATTPAVSILPEDSLAQVGELYSSGRSPVAAAAVAQDVRVEFIDANAAAADQLSTETESSGAEPGLEEWLAAGAAFADAEADKGTELLLLGDFGPGTTTAAATIIGAICGIEPVKVIGWGSGVDDQGWRRKVAQIRDGMFAVRDVRTEPREILARVATPHIAVLTGILAQAAIRRTPVIFDGAGCAAAALCAQMLAPTARDWWQPASHGTEPAIVPALGALGLSPILPTGIGLGQGAGTLLALPHLRLATQFAEGEA